MPSVRPQINLDKVATTHEEDFGTCDVIIQCPGRINIIGEHIDYNHGYVLPAAINRHLYFAISESKNGDFTFHTLNFGQSLIFKEISKITGDEWQHYILGILATVKDESLLLEPIHCTLGGNIPVGAGLSTSAALCVGLIFGLNELFQWGLDRRQMALLAQKSEHRAGISSGIMDQYAVLFGKPDHAILLDCMRVRHLEIPVINDDMIWLLVNSGISHRHAAGAYNDLTQRSTRILKTITNHDSGIQTFRDITPDSIDTYPLSPEEREVLTFIIQERLRVIESVKYIIEGNWNGLGQCLYHSHEGLSSRYGVSIDEMDHLVSLAGDFDGVLGARMIGGGFGGCTLNLLRREMVEEFVSYVAQEYQARWQTIPSFYPVRIDSGILRLK